MTGEDLGYKPSVIEPTRFNYLPLGKVFTKGLDKDEDKKEGFFKGLQNIEHNNKELLDEMKDQKTTKSNKKNNKTRNLLIYDSKHSFEKYKLSKFNEIASIGSKFERINKCYNKFIALMDVDVEPENAEHKLLVFDKVSKLYHDLITEYKKIMKGSLKMIKVMLGSKNMTLKIWKT